MFATKLCNTNTVLSDFDGPTLELLKSNTERNFPDPVNRPICSQLSWGDSNSMSHFLDGAEIQPPFELIIGSDIVYYREAVVPLIK
jgi:hypothetical protein